MSTDTSAPADAAMLPSNTQSNAVFIVFPFQRLFNFPDEQAAESPFGKQQRQKHLAVTISTHVGFILCLGKKAGAIRSDRLLEAHIFKVSEVSLRPSVGRERK